jgi:thioredoxin-dependent peroxiredoxin
LCDTDRKVGLAYGACDKPTDSAARRITYVIGADGKIEQVHGKVVAKEHPFTLLPTLA